MSELRQISIKQDVYERLKDYCGLNGIKISEAATEFIKTGLMNIMYGDIPFGTVVPDTQSVKNEEVVTEGPETIEDDGEIVTVVVPVQYVVNNPEVLEKKEEVATETEEKPKTRKREKRKLK